MRTFQNKPVRGCRCSSKGRALRHRRDKSAEQAAPFAALEHSEQLCMCKVQWSADSILGKLLHRRATMHACIAIFHYLYYSHNILYGPVLYN